MVGVVWAPATRVVPAVSRQAASRRSPTPNRVRRLWDATEEQSLRRNMESPALGWKSKVIIFIACCVCGGEISRRAECPEAHPSAVANRSRIEHDNPSHFSLQGLPGIHSAATWNHRDTEPEARNRIREFFPRSGLSRTQDGGYHQEQLS